MGESRKWGGRRYGDPRKRQLDERARGLQPSARLAGPGPDDLDDWVREQISAEAYDELADHLTATARYPATLRGFLAEYGLDAGADPAAVLQAVADSTRRNAGEIRLLEQQEQAAAMD